MTDPQIPGPGASPTVEPPAPAPLASSTSTSRLLPIIGAALAGIAFLTAVIPGASYSTWFFAIGAIVVAIIAFAKHAPLRGLTVAAVVVAPVAWLIAIIVSVATIASGVSSGIDSGQTQPAPVASNQSAAPGATASPATISGGDHVVGADFAPGQYRAEVSKGIIELCTVSQSDSAGNVTDLRNSNEGSVIFTVQNLPDSVVSFSGCDNIALAADVLRTNPSPITNGDWLVGSEIPAGKYKGTVDTTSIVKLGTIDQSKGKDVIDLNNGNEGDVIFTVQNIPGSVVSFTGLVNIKKIG